MNARKAQEAGLAELSKRGEIPSDKRHEELAAQAGTNARQRLLGTADDETPKAGLGEPAWRRYGWALVGYARATCAKARLTAPKGVKCRRRMLQGDRC